jgi:hypothetical protein
MLITDSKEFLVQFLKSWAGKITPSEYPLFKSQEATQLFLQLIKSAAIYVEYGAGGTTVQAAKIPNLEIISVEHDFRFAKSVEKLIKLTGGNIASLNQSTVDIGATGKYGRPLFYCRNSCSRITKFRNYVNAPYGESSREHAVNASIVMVDGRFRVACVLKTLLENKNKNLKIIVDDFVGRDCYNVLKDISVVEKVVGTMAILSRKDNQDDQILRHLLECYLYDPR